MVQLKKYHKITLLIFTLSLILLIDKRVGIEGDNITILSYTQFKKSYTVYYKNPLKRFLKPKVDVMTPRGFKTVIVTIKKNRVTIKGEGLPGNYIFNVNSNKYNFIRKINFTVNSADEDGDGFYNLVELDTQEDKESFVNWFTSIAKSQFYKMNAGWDNIHRDCSGLITFSYKEALKKHDMKWLNGFSSLDEQRDVEKYNYPDIPILGVNCFNTAFGFKPSANASSLLNYNMSYISKDFEDLKKVDILFYYDDEYEMPYHSMIYLGEPGYVVYHTGPIDDDNSGEVRMVLLSDLLKHPDEKWHPKEYNEKFLGGFRWHILM